MIRFLEERKWLAVVITAVVVVIAVVVAGRTMGVFQTHAPAATDPQQVQKMVQQSIQRQIQEQTQGGAQQMNRPGPMPLQAMPQGR